MAAPTASPDEAPFADLLKRSRATAGLTQAELAERAGLSLRTVQYLEGGHGSPYADTARRLADALWLTGTTREEFEQCAHDVRRLRLGFTPPSADDSPLSGAPGASRGAHLQTAEQPIEAVAAKRTLPRDVPSFTGRTEELGGLLAAVSDMSRRDTGGVVATIDGMAGAGKTAFAVHVAHQLTPEFPDGQLYLDLRAHAMGQRPVAPADALASLLLCTGLPARLIPHSLPDRMSLWRDRAVGKKMLILLDDALGTDQVRPLLPGAGGCLTLITSRRRLMALEDAIPLTLGTLPPRDAYELLTRLIGTPAGETESRAVAEVADLCGQLPLALRIVAGRMRSHPTWSLDDIVRTLRAAQDRLGEFQSETLGIEATFNLSYRGLTTDQQHLFRSLGLHPGQEIDVYAAAALDGCTLQRARYGLEWLYSSHLLEESSPGRYRLHDLIREYASALARQDDLTDAVAALDRLMDYYLQTAATATRIAGESTDITGRPRPEYGRGRSPDLGSRRSALKWLASERTNLSACVLYAAAHSRESRAVEIAHAMHAYLQSAGCWDQLLADTQVAVAAARRAPERDALAIGLLDTARIQRLMGNFSSANESVLDALALFREIGDRMREANALLELGLIQRVTSAGDGRADANTSLTSALSVFRELSDESGQARCLFRLGTIRQEASDYSLAMTYLIEARSLFRDLGDLPGEANVLVSMGRVQYWSGTYHAASASLVQAEALFQELSDPFGRANALNELGRVQGQLGQLPQAAASHTSALDIYRELGSRIGEENALAYLGVVLRSMGDYRAARASLVAALSIAATVRDKLGEANGLTELAMVQHALGEHSAASTSVYAALAICQQIGDRVGQAEALNCAGTLLVDTSAAEAVTLHRAALRLARELCCPLEEARALEGVGVGLIRLDELSEGLSHLHRALCIYKRLTTPDVERVQALLAA